jgi:hypothetical protein
MAYGLKYELFFSDVTQKRFKIEILEKDFVLDPFGVGTEPTQLVGTGDPCVIEWNADDDIYSPIIGSNCTLNLFVTNTTIYDEFYKSDERKYKVRILEYTSFGGNWEDIDVDWDGADQIYDAKLGSAVFYIPIWEGFIVVDRYQEAVVSEPYQITLNATDGLGMLEAYDVPRSTVVASEENLFFYLKEILKLTGLEFDLYIANDTRLENGAANDTIFHDIDVNNYIFSDKNLILMNAKKVLKEIMKITNSRVFQSYGRWYVVNNSSLIDNRVSQLTVAESDPDVINEPTEPTPTPVYGSPDITILGASPMYFGTSYSLLAQNTGTEVVQFVWTYPDNSTVTQNKGDSFFGILNIPSANLVNGDTYSVVGTDANGQTDSDSFTLNVQTQTTTPTQGQTGEVPEDDPNVNEPTTIETPPSFNLLLNITNEVTGGYISQTRILRTYTAAEVGDSFSESFLVTSLNGEFTSVSQISTLTTTYGTISKALEAEAIRVTVTGTLPTGGHTGQIVVKGASEVQQFTDTYTISETISNATISPGSATETGGTGKAYTKTFLVNAATNFGFAGIGSISVLASANIGQVISVSKNSDTQLQINVSNTLGIENRSTTLSVTGTTISAGDATNINPNPSGPVDIAESLGYFDLNVSPDGNFRVTPNVTWLTVSPTEGNASTTRIRVNFETNNSGSSRRGSINFYKRATNTLIDGVRIDQDFTG